MNRDQRIRIVKREERVGAAAPTAGKASEERELKRVVSGWITEHRQHAEELRRGAAALLGLQPRPQIFKF